MFKFHSETHPSIPLPPEYTFPQAFNYLHAEKNSFYILERGDKEFIQCGGDKSACSVEVRLLQEDGTTTLFVVGHKEGEDSLVHIPMSGEGVHVKQREVLTHWEAIKLFNAFFNRQPFPEEYSLREQKL